MGRKVRVRISPNHSRAQISGRYVQNKLDKRHKKKKRNQVTNNKGGPHQPIVYSHSAIKMKHERTTQDYMEVRNINLCALYNKHILQCLLPS
jgi:hypothetical protein